MKYWRAGAMALAVLMAAPGWSREADPDKLERPAQGPIAGKAEVRPDRILAAPGHRTLALSVTLPSGPSAGDRLGMVLADNIAPFVAAVGLTGQRGALVFEVARNSPAAQAGVRPGDLIVSAAGNRLRDASQLEWMLRALETSPIDLQVIRVGDGPEDLLVALQAGAEAGNRDAVMALGDARLFSLDGLRRFGSAEEFYLRAHAMGDARAAHRLGWMYATGRGVPMDLAVATRWYRLATEAGLPAGQHALGLAWWNARYWTGQALVRDYGEAVRLFRLAAAQGHTASALYLGLAHQFGYGTAIDHSEAVAWYDRAIAAGDAEAMLRRAEMYEQGLGSEPEPDRALELLRTAAQFGSVDANRRLGERYWRGDGVAQHPLQALAYFGAAAEAGDTTAMTMMAEILLSGYGVRRDAETAMQWYFRAYQAGDADAGYMLALAYADGVGVAEDKGKVAGFMFGAIRGGSRAALEEMRANAEAWDRSVREDLQRLLQASGFYSGEIDGVFGPGTQRALQAAASAAEG